MKKENVLFGIIGLLAGLIVGFMFANSINQNAAIPVAASGPDPVKSNSNLPAGHPDIGSSTKPPDGRDAARGDSRDRKSQAIAERF